MTRHGPARRVRGRFVLVVLLPLALAAGFISSYARSITPGAEQRPAVVAYAHR